MRLLFDPLAAAGIPPANPLPPISGHAPPAAPAPAAAPPPPPAPAAPAMVPLTVEEWQRLRSFETQLTELRAAKDIEVAAKEAERIRALAEKGQVDEALKQTRESYDAKLHESTTRYTELERQIFAERKSAVIGQALSGFTFAGETPEIKAEVAANLKLVIEGRFETVRDASGTLLVRDKTTGRPASEVLKETLASPAYAVYFAPQSRGGSGTPGNSTNSPPLPAGVKPGSLEHIAANFRERQGQYQSFGLHANPR